MKRRDLLKNAAAAGAAALGSGYASAEDKRLFGVPNSVARQIVETHPKRRLRLSMSRNDVPVAVWKRFEELSDFWEEITQNPDKYKTARDVALSNDRQLANFLQDKRFDTQEHRVLLKLSDPLFIQYAHDSDYISLLSAMNSQGLLELGDDLADHYTRALQDDRATLQRLKDEFDQKFPAGKLYDKENYLDDIAYFQDRIIPTAQLNARNNAVAAINVVVGINVAVAVNVAVGVAVAVAVAVAVEVAVCGATCHGKVSSSERLQKDAEAVTLLANRVGNPELARQSIIELHCREAAACLTAAHKLGLITIAEPDRKEVYRRLYTVVRKGLEA